MAKKLPRGLQEHENTLDEPAHMRHLLMRLRDLPGWEEETKEAMGHLAHLHQDLNNAEVALAVAKLQLRNHAKKIWRATVRKYSIKELQEVTGYDR